MYLVKLDQDPMYDAYPLIYRERLALLRCFPLVRRYGLIKVPIQIF